MIFKFISFLFFCWSSLSCFAQGSRTPHAYAIVVGVNEYQDDKIPSLKYAAGDAERFYHFLKTSYGMDSASGNVKLLLNKNATRKTVLNTVSRLAGRSEEYNSDVLIFYFSGHGTGSEIDHNGYFLTSDAVKDEPAGSAISMSEIKTIIERSKARIKLCFIDACHAGFFSNDPNKGLEEDRISQLNEKLKSLAKGIPGSVIFLSSTQRLESEEADSLKSGRFTYYLLKGLQGEADKYSPAEAGRNDGKVTVGEMINYLSSEIQRSSGYRQRPFLNTTLEDSSVLNIVSAVPGLPTGIGNSKNAVMPHDSDPGSAMVEAREALARMGVQWNGKNFLDEVETGDELIVTLFLKGGMQPETAESDARPLSIMLALNKKNPEKILDLLLAYKLDINTSFKQFNGLGDVQTNMLGSAIQLQNTRLATALLKNKINPDLPVPVTGAYGIAVTKHPLHAAILNHQPQMANLLLDAKCNISLGDYEAYREAYTMRNDYFWQEHAAEIKHILERIAPPAKKQKTIDAEVRIYEINKELADIGKKTMETIWDTSKKNEYDKKYNSLLEEKSKLMPLLKDN